MSEFNHSNLSGGNAPDPDYKWTYEYYDDDEPVSFEGLKAHRCKYRISVYSPVLPLPLSPIFSALRMHDFIVEVNCD